MPKTLIVGTTPDYIHWIRQACPESALFITDPDVRRNAREEAPLPAEEILVPLSSPLSDLLSDRDRVLSALNRHLVTWDLTLDGIFCFDCESMPLTAVLAESLGLEYPSLKAVQNCRDKFISKQIWQENGVGCPVAKPVNRVEEAIAFLKATSSGCVLKPLAGSGSELVFSCRTPAECRSAFAAIKKGLKKRKADPLFHTSVSEDSLMVAEERISGVEFSCDFIVDRAAVRILRIARKITSPFGPFGTILGYVTPASLPNPIQMDDLTDILLKGARALGIEKGLCMVDFFISKDRIQLIEMTPRPGGDCLPYLLNAVSGLDILKLSLDFSKKNGFAMPQLSAGSVHVGIRLLARKAGVLEQIDTSGLNGDPRVKAILLKKHVGQTIQLPPEDYDSWILGHVIVEPSAKDFPESQAIALSKKIDCRIC